MRHPEAFVFSQTLHAVAATVGFTSWLLLWAAVVLGLVVRNGWSSTRWRHSTMEGAHGTLALLGLTLGLVHGGAQLAVPNGIVRVVDEVVPFVNPYDPVGVGAGVLSLELFLAGALSVLIRKRLGQSRWRAVHTLTYAAFLLLTAHVLISGSDVGPMWLWMSIVAACAIVLLLWLASTRVVGRVRTRLGRLSTARDRAQTLMIDVDPTRCQRFGFCEHEAPEVFRLQGDGRLAYRTYVPAESVEPVIRAVGVCPARAIALRRLPTTVVTPDPGPIPEITPAGGFPQQGRPRTAGMPSVPVGVGAPRRTSRARARAERQVRGR
jgi:ferredoxin/DMSO/TMAO reductase YedYZ heme-binding membrane subunit